MDVWNWKTDRTVKICDQDHHQSVVMETGLRKFLVGTSEGEVHNIDLTASRGLR